MNYRDKINKLVLEGNQAQFLEWLLSQPQMEQVEIMRELKQLTLEFSKKTNLTIPEDVPMMEEYDKKMDAFEDSILNMRLGEDMMAKDNETMENHIRKMATADYNIREHIIYSIANDEPDAPQMRRLAQRMIALEKKENLHDPEKWKGLPEHL